jgi:hypothetical protein
VLGLLPGRRLQTDEVHVVGDFNEDGVDDVAICAPNVLRQLAEPVLKIFLSDP